MKEQSWKTTKKTSSGSLASFAILIQRYIKDKADVFKIPCRDGIYPSIIMAECIYKSDWGTKIVAKKENNLLMLEKDEFSRLKGIEYEGKIYTTYDNWLDFSISAADYYTFTKKYNTVLMSRNLDEQIDLLSKLQDYPKAYCDILELSIGKYGLWEFDSNF